MDSLYWSNVGVFCANFIRKGLWLENMHPCCRHERRLTCRKSLFWVLNSLSFKQQRSYKMNSFGIWGKLLWAKNRKRTIWTFRNDYLQESNPASETKWGWPCPSVFFDSPEKLSWKPLGAVNAAEYLSLFNLQCICKGHRMLTPWGCFCSYNWQ